MDKVTLRQLRYFDALGRHRHFGRAAAACAVSQPALSVQIRELEARLGAPLVERGARQVRLTGLGEDLARRAEAILRAVDELVEAARAAGEGRLGRLRLGVIPTIAPYLLPRIIRALAARFPGVDIHVRETLTERLIGELRAGRLDTAILALPVSEPSLTEMALFEESFLLVRPAAEAGEPVPAPEALAERRLLLLEEGHCFRDQALALCKLPTVRAGEGMEGSALSTLVQMVAAGLGVTLIPEMAMPVEARSADVSVARFPAPEPSRAVGMVWRRASPLAERLQEIAAIVRGVHAQARESAAAEGGKR